MQIHDVGLISVYYSIWGVIDAINQTEGLAYKFPDHDCQKEMREDFDVKVAQSVTMSSEPSIVL